MFGHKGKCLTTYIERDTYIHHTLTLVTCAYITCTPNINIYTCIIHEWVTRVQNSTNTCTTCMYMYTGLCHVISGYLEITMYF